MSETPSSSEHNQDDLYRDPTGASWTQPVPPPPPAPEPAAPAAAEPPPPPPPYPGAVPPPPAYPGTSPYPEAPAYPTQEQLQQQLQQQYPPAQPPTSYGQDAPGAPAAYGAPAPQPYGAAGYGQQPYGQQAYGQAPPGYGYPPPGVVNYGQSTTNGSAIALTIVSALAVFSCFGTLQGIVGLIFGIIGLSKQSSDPEGSRRITRTGWIVFGALVALSVVGFIIWVAVVAARGGTYEYNYGT